MKAKKQQYATDDIVKYEGKETKILSVRDGRDYSDMCRPDFIDGLEYELIDSVGDSIFVHWWDFDVQNTTNVGNEVLAVTSSTNSEVGSSHWFRTIISQHKHIGEYLMTQTPTEEILREWGKTMYETSEELIKGHNLIK